MSTLLKQVILGGKEMLFFGSLHKNCFYLHLRTQFSVIGQKNACVLSGLEGIGLARLDVGHSAL